MAERRLREVTVPVVTVTSNHPFEETRVAFEGALGRLDESIFEDLKAGNVQKALEKLRALPPLVIAAMRDHGSLLKVAGQNRKAIRYDCGNALSATEMTRHELSAGLYAPLRVLLREDASGEVAFEYERPTVLFGSLGNSEVDDVAERIERLLVEAIELATS